MFLTYQLPDACRRPESNVSVAVMRTLVSCAVEVELPPSDFRFMIGFEEPVTVDSARMDQIMTDVGRTLGATTPPFASGIPGAVGYPIGR